MSLGPWTNEDEALLLRLRDVEEVTWEEICRRLKRSMGSVRGKYQRLKRSAQRIDDHGEGVVFEAFGPNRATATAKCGRIKTLEQLLEACEVDLSVWRVERYLVNKWEVGAKAAHKDLKFTKGVIDGTILEEGLTISPLFQVKAWLARIKPIPVFPTIRPVECGRPAASPVKVHEGDIGRSLVIADPHFGFIRDLRTGELIPLHDPRALDIVKQLADLCHPVRVDLLGDLLDFASWTDKFLRTPEFAGSTQEAIVAAHHFLCELREILPEAEIRLHEGNHDRRMRDAIVTHLRAAYDLRAADELDLPPAMSVQRLLALHKIGVEWIGEYPKGADWLNDHVRVSHGERAQAWGGSTAKAVVAETTVTEIFGHIHRMEWIGRTIHLRDTINTIVGFCPGCLCHIDGRVPSKKAREQWQNGLAVVDYETAGPGFHISPILIEHGRAIWNGQRIESRV